MNRMLLSLCGLALMSALPVAAEAPAPDARVKVDMPAAAVAVFRDEMRAKMEGLQQALAALADNTPATAADVVERTLGMGAMQQHMQLPAEARPGRYAPTELRQLGMQSHHQGSALAAALRAGDRPRIDAALRDVTASCVACHAAFRIF